MLGLVGIEKGVKELKCWVETIEALPSDAIVGEEEDDISEGKSQVRDDE